MLEFAERVIETVLFGMKTVRREMRVGLPVELSVPQFRMLRFLKFHQGMSLSELADCIGLALPSMSKTVDGLVRRGLVSRVPSTDDRRRVVLTLTEAGEQAFETARQATRSRIAAMLAVIPPEDRDSVLHAVDLLRQIFMSERSDIKC
jgi:DNA-binding MarR family transcriptional regulator